MGLLILRSHCSCYTSHIHHTPFAHTQTATPLPLCLDFAPLPPLRIALTVYRSGLWFLVTALPAAFSATPSGSLPLRATSAGYGSCLTGFHADTFAPVPYRTTGCRLLRFHRTRHHFHFLYCAFYGLVLVAGSLPPRTGSCDCTHTGFVCRQTLRRCHAPARRTGRILRTFHTVYYTHHGLHLFTTPRSALRFASVYTRYHAFTLHCTPAGTCGLPAFGFLPPDGFTYAGSATAFFTFRTLPLPHITTTPAAFCGSCYAVSLGYWFISHTGCLGRTCAPRYAFTPALPRLLRFAGHSVCLLPVHTGYGLPPVCSTFRRGLFHTRAANAHHRFAPHHRTWFLQFYAHHHTATTTAPFTLPHFVGFTVPHSVSTRSPAGLRTLSYTTSPLSTLPLLHLYLYVRYLHRTVHTPHRGFWFRSDAAEYYTRSAPSTFEQRFPSPHRFPVYLLPFTQPFGPRTTRFISTVPFCVPVLHTVSRFVAFSPPEHWVSLFLATRTRDAAPSRCYSRTVTPAPSAAHAPPTEHWTRTLRTHFAAARFAGPRSPRRTSPLPLYHLRTYRLFTVSLPFCRRTLLLYTHCLAWFSSRLHVAPPDVPPAHCTARHLLPRTLPGHVPLRSAARRRTFSVLHYTAHTPLRCFRLSRSASRPFCAFGLWVPLHFYTLHSLLHVAARHHHHLLPTHIVHTGSTPHCRTPHTAATTHGLDLPTTHVYRRSVPTPPDVPERPHGFYAPPLRLGPWLPFPCHLPHCAPHIHTGCLRTNTHRSIHLAPDASLRSPAVTARSHVYALHLPYCGFTLHTVLDRCNTFSGRLPHGLRTHTARCHRGQPTHHYGCLYAGFICLPAGGPPHLGLQRLHPACSGRPPSHYCLPRGFTGHTPADGSAVAVCLLDTDTTSHDFYLPARTRLPAIFRRTIRHPSSWLPASVTPHAWFTELDGSPNTPFNHSRAGAFAGFG